jgi:hypothetical protein
MICKHKSNFFKPIFEKNDFILKFFKIINIFLYKKETRGILTQFVRSIK